MRRRRRTPRTDARRAPRARALLALLAAALLLSAPTVHAQLDTSLRDRLAEEARRYQQMLDQRRAEVRDIERSLGDTRQRLEERIAERDRVSAQLADLEQRRRELQARIAELQEERGRTEERIAEEESNLSALRERIRSLLVNLHRQRVHRGATVLARADSLHDLQVKNYYLSLLSRQDVQLVAEVDAQLAELRELRQQLSDQLAELSRAEQQLADNQAALETARAELQSIIAELDQTREGQQAQRAALMEAQSRLESELAATESRLQREIERLEEEERRLRAEAERFVNDREQREALLQEAERTRERITNLTSPQQANASGFVGPLEGGRLISAYGEGNNSFVALRAPEENAAVFAVQGGVVVAAQSIGANDGYMVAIRHDAVLTTVYTNLRPPEVRVGDQVARGEVIGFLGGGTIPPPDVLRLYARARDGGREAFVDPRTALGL